MLTGVLYLISILHQTTTGDQTKISGDVLYLISILHQTTTIGISAVDVESTLSYLNFTSNHNCQMADT